MVSKKSQHHGFQQLSLGKFKTKGKYKYDFKCGYITDYPPVHSKVYSWLKNGEPVMGFMGSANYTQNAFSRSMREVLTEKEPVSCFDYYQNLIGSTVDCLTGDVSDLIERFEQRRRKGALIINAEQETAIITDTEPDKVTLTLLDNKTGETPTRSGLNWGQRDRRNRNQAYINIPAKIGNSGFFPARFVQFMVLTDDGKEMICRRGSDGGKGLTSTFNNSLLGEYFRYRLGTASGAYITKDDLLRYGRTDVDFHKIDDETYLMNFSVY